MQTTVMNRTQGARLPKAVRNTKSRPICVRVQAMVRVLVPLLNWAATLRIAAALKVGGRFLCT